MISTPLLAIMATLAPLVLLTRIVDQRWLAPGNFFAAYWLVASTLPVLFLDDAAVTVVSLMYIAFAVLVFALGAGAASMRTVSRQCSFGPIPRRHAWVLRALTYSGALTALAAAAFAIEAGGFQISNVLSLQGLFATGNSISISRYDGGAGSPVVAGLLAITYAACLVSPFAFLDGIGGSRWVRMTCPLLAVLVYSAFTTERLGLLLGASFTLCGYLVARLLRDGRFPHLTFRSVIVTLASAALLGTLFVGIAFVRVGRSDAGVQRAVASKMEVYALGYLPAFSVWLTDYQLAGADAPLGYGTSSVAGISLLTGQSRDATRAYGDRAQITSGGATTNVYTIFRNLLLDFGRAGSALALLLWGFTTGRAYRSVLERRSPLGAVILGASYASIMLSNTMAITTFSNVCAAVLVALVVVCAGFSGRSESRRGEAVLDLRRPPRPPTAASGIESETLRP